MSSKNCLEFRQIQSSGTRKRLPLFLILVLVSVNLVSGEKFCVDVDKREDKLSPTIREKMTEDSLYCDQTISWDVSNKTILNKDEHLKGI